MEDLRLSLFILGYIFLLLKLNTHFSIFYKNKEDYPGFIKAFRELPRLKKIEAVLPIPYLGNSNNANGVRKIIIYLVLAVLSIFLGFALPFAKHQLIAANLLQKR